MLFNSIQFAIFFAIVTGLYFALPHRFRWSLLLLASCLFYMAFIPAYIAILLVTILIDYFAALFIEKARAARKLLLLTVSVISTCLVLFAFKYFAFFAQNLEALAHCIGWNYRIETLNLILPIGLSFHTFQSLSYVVEVYRGRQKAERHFGIYALYVMFYPQLVAGPIERPQNLLHQFREVHTFDYNRLTSGLRLMAWGLFKKAVIADRLAMYVNGVYGNPREYSGWALVSATIAFAYQIYCDFSGYSDIAIGSARVMGFKLMTNFDCPYHSESIAEFWKRWHISLSTWFRDYLYIPMGGRHVSTSRWYANLLVTFLVSGLWHGANWTFVLWGLLNGFYLVCGIITHPWRETAYRRMGLDVQARGVRVWRVVFTFFLTCCAWVLFRANSVSDAWYILTWFLRPDVGTSLRVDSFWRQDLMVALLAIGFLEMVQIYRRWEPRLDFSSLPLVWRWSFHYAFLLVIILFGVYRQSQFIYFQF